MCATHDDVHTYKNTLVHTHKQRMKGSVRSLFQIEVKIFAEIPKMKPTEHCTRVGLVLFAADSHVYPARDGSKGDATLIRLTAELPAEHFNARDEAARSEFRSGPKRM